MAQLNAPQSPRRERIPLLRQIARFAVVGVINTTVDLTVLNTLILVTARGRNGLLYSVFKTISFAAAVGNSYLMNSRWTFSQSVSRISSGQAGRFLSISLLGLATNVGTASWIASLSKLASFGDFGQMATYWPSVAALAGSSCSLAFNFLGYKYLVFSRPGRPASVPLPRTQSTIAAQEPVASATCLSAEEG